MGLLLVHGLDYRLLRSQRRPTTTSVRRWPSCIAEPVRADG